VLVTFPVSNPPAAVQERTDPTTQH
jgi:hypothetical protein